MMGMRRGGSTGYPTDYGGMYMRDPGMGYGATAPDMGQYGQNPRFNYGGYGEQPAYDPTQNTDFMHSTASAPYGQRDYMLPFSGLKANSDESIGTAMPQPPLMGSTTLENRLPDYTLSPPLKTESSAFLENPDPLKPAFYSGFQEPAPERFPFEDRPPPFYGSETQPEPGAQSRPLDSEPFQIPTENKDKPFKLGDYHQEAIFPQPLGGLAVAENKEDAEESAEDPGKIIIIIYYRF